MSFRTELLDKLLIIAENPENAFDKIISDNKDCLPQMSEERLCEIYTLRHESLRLCRIVPYERDEIASLIENNEVSPYKLVAKLENHFLIVEYLFERFRERNI